METSEEEINLESEENVEEIIVAQIKAEQKEKERIMEKA